MMKKWLLGVLMFPIAALSQTFNGTTGAIIDNGTANFTAAVSGIPTVLNNVHGLESVCMNIAHSYDSDLEIYLIAPDGSAVLLFNNVGGGNDNFTNTCLNQQASTPIGDGSAPFTGTYQPQGDMGILNNGQSPNGSWTLRVRDTYADDGGNVLSWSITFGNNPAPVFSSNLPIVVINTLGNAAIPDDPKIEGSIKTIKNASGRNYVSGPFQYQGKIGIEQRGSSSSMFDKKSYGFETKNASYLSIDTNMLGMPAQSDWVLSANYSDKSLMNNMLAYRIYRDMGHYAPRTEYCELFLNGEYRGVYVCMEKIKRDSNRVSISKLTTTDNFGDEVTGGYIVKIDKTTGSPADGWTSPVPSVSGAQINYQYEYPKTDVITGLQKTYIKNFFDEFENNLNSAGYSDPVTGYRKYIKLRGWLDYFLLNEVSKNIDGYRLSTFIYKEKITDGNKLSFTPWDYDLGFGNANYFNGSETVGWSYNFPDPGDGNQPPFWWARLLQDPAFQNDLKCRYTYLRSNVLSTTRLHSFADSVATVLDEGQTRNFEKFNILGTQVWPNPTPVPADYEGEVTELKTWLTNRLSWLDNNIPGTCIVSNIGDEIEETNTASAYPNPAENNTTISWFSDNNEDLDILVVNSVGQVLIQQTIKTTTGENLYRVNLENAEPGIYMIHLHNDLFSEKVKVVRTP